MTAPNPTTTRPPATLSAASLGRDILAGISVMVLAIANRQNLADQDVPPRPCSEQYRDRPDLYCVAPVGHDGTTCTTSSGIWTVWLFRPPRG